MRLLDSHCHPEYVLKAGRLAPWIEECRGAGVEGVVAIGTDLTDWSAYRDLAASHPAFFRHTVGLHPCHVEEGWEETVAAVGPYFADATPPAALGEIGLDYFRLPAEVAEAERLKGWQQAAFRRQLALAYQLACPVVVHSRHAFEDCVRLIDDSGVDWRKVVFHCFVEGPEQVRQLNQRGGRASFTGIITYAKSEDIRQALKAQGLSRLMLETDAPYLAPRSVRGKENTPAYLPEICAQAAELLGLPADEVAEVVTRNAREFFGF
ncbi:MAG: TatD family hydrolase [Opitutia bacterium]